MSALSSSSSLSCSGLSLPPGPLFSAFVSLSGVRLLPRLADLERDGWDERHVYIDKVNLSTRTDGAFLPQEGNEGFVLNHHWAEYYTMGVLVCHTVVLVLDAAWLDSLYCQGELRLFCVNFRRAYTDAQAGRAPGSEFRLVVLYDANALEGKIHRVDPKFAS